MNNNSEKVSYLLFIISILLLVYMPLHVLIVQSASLLTGGLDIWKAAKDILVVCLVPALLILSHKRGLFKDKTFRILIIIGGLYALLHLLFVIIDQNDDTRSAIVGSVYNTRLIGYLLLGYVVGSAKNGQKYLRYLLTATVIVATVVALFGILQYFLPSDLLTHVGYSLDRGVKPMFFIDDKPDLPRIMSTLKDPNSLGAFLIFPILLTGYALTKKTLNEKLFAQPFRRGVLVGMLAIQLSALLLTFSRGALIGLMVSLVTLLCIVKGKQIVLFSKNYRVVFLGTLVIIVGLFVSFRDSYFVQNVIFHADKSTVLEDPNELRVTFLKQTVEKVVKNPLGYGPGTAGLVAITNPKGGALTENYYLQIAYETGWLGIALFVIILVIIGNRLYCVSRKSPIAAVLLASLAGYLFYSLLIHLWSNEALALQWWLLCGIILGLTMLHKDKSSA